MKRMCKKGDGVKRSIFFFFFEKFLGKEIKQENLFPSVRLCDWEAVSATESPLLPRRPDAAQITWPCPWTCDRRSGAFSLLRPGRALSHSTSGAGGCRRQGSPTFNHVRGVVSTPRYIAPPYRGSNGDSVAETASQSQRRTLGNRFSCLISLPKNFSKKKKKSISLHHPLFYTFFSSTNTRTHLIHAPHMANCQQNLDQFLSLFTVLCTRQTIFLFFSLI